MNSEAAVLTKEITAATYIFIGPEGDFSEPEIEAAKEKGFKELHLGETILRTETAGMVATALYRNL
jgi:16S rRNA (uracil1498-N3)-methyltransferase